MTVGDILQKYRKMDNMSLRQQAEKIGISLTYLFDIQKGNRNLSYEVFKKIVTTYRYRCVGEDFLNLSYHLNSPEVFTRYKKINNLHNDEKAMRDFIYIITGDVL